jgi:hypothetical protein
LKVSHVSGEYVVSIFRVEEQAEQKTNPKADGKPNYFHPSFFQDLLFDIEDGGIILFRIVC